MAFMQGDAKYFWCGNAAFEYPKMWHSQAQISNTGVTSTIRRRCSLLDSCWNLNALLAIYVKVEQMIHWNDI